MHLDEASTQAHRERMVRKKAVVDAAIDRAQRDQGVVVVMTGNGKGKSSSAFGMAVRALGHGINVGIVQFIKGAIPTGEELFLRRLSDGVRFHVAGGGYTWETQDAEADTRRAQEGWLMAREMLRDASLGLVILDEFNIVLKYRYIEAGKVVEALAARPPMQHVVLTGRGAPGEIIAAADTVSEIHPVKHAFANGIRAQKGVEL